MQFPSSTSYTCVSQSKLVQSEPPKIHQQLAVLKDAIQLESQGQQSIADKIYFQLFWEDPSAKQPLNYDDFVPAHPDQYSERHFALCEQYGLPTANFLLGKMYLTGKGVELSLANADKCFQQAAAQGFEFASHSLDLRYQLGMSTLKTDPQKAQKLLEEIADKHGGAAYALGEIYAHKPAPQKWTVAYYFADYFCDAIDYYKLADKLGHPTAAKRLVEKSVIAENKGLYQEFSSLIKYYVIAAKKKLLPEQAIAALPGGLFKKSTNYHTHARCETSTTSKLLYLKISEEFKKAAADLGHPDAALSCARKCEENGQIDQAKTYYQLAGKQYPDELKQYLIRAGKLTVQVPKNRSVLINT